MRRKKTWAVLLFLALLSGSSQWLTGGQTGRDGEPFHSDAERAAFSQLSLSTIGPGEYFLTSEHCRGCHGYDSTGLANVDANGNSVNLFDHWQSTMMANSARDPLWRAKVSHEILLDTVHAAALQDKCTSCHAPMGRYNAFFHGTGPYSLDTLYTDSLGFDGISCAGCHTTGPSVGQTFSGLIPYDTTRTIYGPFTFPLTGPMQLYEGYTPTYGAHMDEARMCASCHTLITETVDTNGVLTGGEFIEQATYHEYLNSSFPAAGITCQTCHMPHLDDAIIIANGLVSLTPRYPFNQHVFAGANAFMLSVIRDNKTALGSTVEDWKFDSTIAATYRLLQDSSIELHLLADSITADTGFFQVSLRNKAGHKFPSGYPSRRAVVTFVVTDALGDTLFTSGTFTPSWRVAGEQPGFEPHHDVIRQSGMPQIYELVMGDVNYQFTTVLERAAWTLKDNRIPPNGFTSLSPVYDTVQISPDALADPDFNKTGAAEGSGADRVHYHVPLTGVSGPIRVYAGLYYQAVPPKWLDEMFLLHSPEIDSFRVMYGAADKTPIRMVSDSLVHLAAAVTPGRTVPQGIQVYPSPAASGRLTVRAAYGEALTEILVFSLNGALVERYLPGTAAASFVFDLPPQKGIYLLKITAGERSVYRKVVRP